MLDMAQVCVGLALGQVAIEGFGQIQPQQQDFRGELEGVRAKHQTNNTPNNTHFSIDPFRASELDDGCRLVSWLGVNASLDQCSYGRRHVAAQVGSLQLTSTAHTENFDKNYR